MPAMAALTPLASITVPLGGQLLELQEIVHAEGAMPLLRIRIREGKRFTVLDVDPASARTLARLFVKETGLTFGAWRQQARLLKALEWLAEGRPVTAIAFDLGYESPSAFIAMFRRTFGVPPGRYLKGR